MHVVGFLTPSKRAEGGVNSCGLVWPRDLISRQAIVNRGVKSNANTGALLCEQSDWSLTSCERLARLAKGFRACKAAYLPTWGEATLTEQLWLATLGRVIGVTCCPRCVSSESLLCAVELGPGHCLQPRCQLPLVVEASIFEDVFC